MWSLLERIPRHVNLLKSELTCGPRKIRATNVNQRTTDFDLSGVPGSTPFRPKLGLRGSEWARWLGLVAFLFENRIKSHGHLSNSTMTLVRPCSPPKASAMTPRAVLETMLTIWSAAFSATREGDCEGSEEGTEVSASLRARSAEGRGLGAGEGSVEEIANGAMEGRRST